MFKLKGAKVTTDTKKKKKNRLEIHFLKSKYNFLRPLAETKLLLYLFWCSGNLFISSACLIKLGASLEGDKLRPAKPFTSVIVVLIPRRVRGD